MNVFIYDSEEVDRRREWKNILPGPHYVCVVNDEFVLSDERGRPLNVPKRKVENGVVVAHHLLGDLSEDGKRRLFASADRAKLSVILVSGEDQGPGGDPEHVYRRRAGVAGPEDRVFAACFSTFWARLKKGERTFDLLEPPGWPEHLVAVYLVARALEEGKVTSKRLGCPEWKGILKDARLEFGETIIPRVLTGRNAGEVADKIRLEMKRLGNAARAGRFPR